jgi:plastocyanin
MFAWGFRNPYALAFSPEDSPLKGALVVANNGADVRGSRPLESDGDDLFVISPGGWYGFPDVFDEQPVTEPRFATSTDAIRGVAPLLLSPDRSDAIGAVDHFQKGTSADGFAFSTSDDFGWKNDIFIAEWGALGFGAQPPQGLPGFNVIHVHFFTTNGLLAGTSNAIFLGNKIQGAASTNNLNGLEHPIDVRFSLDGRTMFVLDYGAAGKTGSGKIWAVTRTGAGVPGGEAPPAAPAPTAVPTPAVVPTPLPPPPAAPAPVTPAPAVSTRVVAQNSAFNPQELTVPAGTTVTWTNPDSVAHTVTWDDRSVDSGLFQPADTFQYTFTTPGTYPYFCIPHGSPGAGMHGTITVSGG